MKIVNFITILELYLVTLKLCESFSITRRINKNCRSENPFFRSTIPFKAEKRIVGGFPVDIKDFPYQVAVTLFSEVICGGSIIGKRWVLSAAHCLIWENPSDYNILSGHTIAKKGHLNYVQSYHKHEGFGKHPNARYHNDIGLFKTTEDFRVGEPGVNIIKITNQEPVAGEIITVSGWGSTEPRSRNDPGLSHVDLMKSRCLSVELRAVQLPVVHREKCDQIHQWQITDVMFCAGCEEGGKDSCQGDSGGPAINSKGELVGIVSHGKGCAMPKKPGVYTNIVKFIDWINHTIAINPC